VVGVVPGPHLPGPACDRRARSSAAIPGSSGRRIFVARASHCFDFARYSGARFIARSPLANGPHPSKVKSMYSKVKTQLGVIQLTDCYRRCRSARPPRLPASLRCCHYVGGSRRSSLEAHRPLLAGIADRRISMRQAPTTYRPAISSTFASCRC